MKTTELKKLIKGAVKEAIQEELKDILLEAVRTPKIGGYAAPSPVMEQATVTMPSNGVPTQSTMTAEQKRNLYEQALGETTISYNSQDAQSFRPQAGYDPANGTLPSGNVGMDQIMSLMTKK